MERKRFLAIVMAVLMVISLIPSMVFAAAPSGELGGKLKIKGLAAVGVTLNADYSKVIPEDVTDEDFIFSWSRETDEKQLTQVGTEKAYTITQDDLGYKLVLELTPAEGSELTGTLTAKTMEVAATEEEAKAVAEQNTDTTEDAQLEEAADEAENSENSQDQTDDQDQNRNETQDTEDQTEETKTIYDTEDEQQTDNSQDTASDETPDEADNSGETDDSQMKIYTEEQLQIDENGKVQTDENGKSAQDSENGNAEEDNTAAALEAQSLDINVENLRFTDLEENYTTVNETLSVTVTNTGDSTLTLKVPQSEYFDIMAEDGSETASSVQIAKGESLMFMVRPKKDLARGDYSDTLIFASEEDAEVSAQVSAEVSVKSTQEQITEVQADPASVSYDKLKEGYDIPESTTVTLTNTGNTIVSMVQPTAENFEIGELSASVLNPGETATFTVTPVTGLTAGNYTESIQIIQTDENGEKTQLTAVNASVTVSEAEKFYKLSVSPSALDFGKVKAGYSEAPEAQKVTVTNEGNTNVTLYAPSASDFKIGKLSSAELAPGESCTFKIRPKDGLKEGAYTETVRIENDQNISAKVNVSFTVKAARKAKIADPADNQITGISADGYTTQSKITFTAVGAGMDNENPGQGDVRYVPYNWKVINTNSWSSAPYTAAFGITKAGTYTLTVVFNRQMYNGKAWENTGDQDTKQVNFSITQAQTVTATPTPQPNGTTTKSAVKTGDNTPIAPFIFILAAAVGCIAGVVIYKKKKK